MMNNYERIPSFLSGFFVFSDLEQMIVLIVFIPAILLLLFFTEGPLYIQRMLAQESGGGAEGTSYVIHLLVGLYSC